MGHRGGRHAGHDRTDHDLEQLRGAMRWGECSQSQLQGHWKPVQPDRCMRANLIYVRMPQSSDTIFSSVIRRIGSRYGLSGVKSDVAVDLPEPFLASYHDTVINMTRNGMMGKATLPLVKLAMLRKPTERLLSQYYSAASFHPEIKEMGLLNFIKNSTSGIEGVRSNSMFSCLRSEENETDVEKVLGGGQYFLGVAERFDESVVLLMEIFGLSYCDVVYQKKGEPGEVERRMNATILETVPLSDQPQEIQAYLKSKKFRKQEHLDFKAYHFAKKHMDKLINSLGRKRFEAKLNKFVEWKKAAQRKCDFVDHFDCYLHHDVGCGHACFDQICKNDPK